MYDKVSGYIGRISGKCRICGNEKQHRAYRVKEMFYGTREEFIYFQCDTCDCMQILDIPQNMENYYKKDYYSFVPVEINFHSSNNIKVDTRVLDVGCGAGKWLAKLAMEGYINLFGCDPFIEKDIFYEPYIAIRKCTVHEVVWGKFELITLLDSFEHMPDPYETLKSIKKMLAPESECLINIPVFPNAAYEAFGINWYQWDAPRHLFLHSVKSMKLLCQKAGLKINSIQYNSKGGQFTSSWLYEQGISYVEQLENPQLAMKYIHEDEVVAFDKYAEELNEKGYGDHALFTVTV